jgi:hypothetical protein
MRQPFDAGSTAWTLARSTSIRRESTAAPIRLARTRAEQWASGTLQAAVTSV